MALLWGPNMRSSLSGWPSFSALWRSSILPTGSSLCSGPMPLPRSIPGWADTLSCRHPPGSSYHGPFRNRVRKGGDPAHFRKALVHTDCGHTCLIHHLYQCCHCDLGHHSQSTPTVFAKTMILTPYFNISYQRILVFAITAAAFSPSLYPEDESR